jgi:hypothetical protein
MYVPASCGPGPRLHSIAVTEQSPLFGSAYMCEEAQSLPSVQVLVWMCTHDRWSRRRSTSIGVRCSENG